MRTSAGHVCETEKCQNEDACAKVQQREHGKRLITFHEMKYHTDRRGGQTSGLHAGRKEPLSDAQYQDLLTKAGAFFTQAQRDVDGQRQTMIGEIRETMAQYGLTLEDLS